jgi:hypothetical protein
VIRLNDERLHLAQPFDDQFGDVTEICDKPQAARAGMKYEPERINCVVRHGERLHRDVADRKLGAGRKDPPVTVSLERAVAANRFCR